MTVSAYHPIFAETDSITLMIYWCNQFKDSQETFCHFCIPSAT